MLDVTYSAGLKEEDKLGKIKLKIEERNGEQCYANKIDGLKKGFDCLRSEADDVRLGSMDVEDMRKMEQTDVTPCASYEEKQKSYVMMRNSLGKQPLEPLESFYCQITLTVMMDPVEVSSGRTFERSAIEKYFAQGKKDCPLTLIPLDDLSLRPNKNLRKTIQEWKERNNMITIVSIKTKIQSSEDEEVLESLDKLKELCIEHELYREWVIMEGYIPVLVGILGTKNRDIRTSSLDILYILAKNSNDNKVCFKFTSFYN